MNAAALCTAALSLGPSAHNAPATCARVVEVAVEEGVDPVLAAALAWHESRFSAIAKSKAGAVGAMQVMPATLRRCRKATPDCGPIRAGVRELGRLLGKYPAERALTFYNAGPTKNPRTQARAERYARAVIRTAERLRQRAASEESTQNRHSVPGSARSHRGPAAATSARLGLRRKAGGMACERVPG